MRAALKRGDDVAGSRGGTEDPAGSCAREHAAGHVMPSIGGSDKLGAYVVAVDGVVDATDCNAK